MESRLTDCEIIDRSRNTKHLLEELLLQNPSKKQVEEFLGFHNACVSIDILDLLQTKPELHKQKVAVLTHPFFNLRGNYGARLNGFIQEFPFPIVVLSYDFESDSQRIGGMSPHTNQFYLDTGYQIAIPQAGYEFTSRIINGFSPVEVVLGGANLEYTEEGTPAACVGFTYRNLKDRIPSLKINKDICNMQ